MSLELIGEAGYINMSQCIDGNQSRATGPDELGNGAATEGRKSNRKVKNRK